MLKNIIVSAVVSVMVVVAGFWVMPKPVVETIVGAVVGPEHTQRQFFKAGATIGGRVATTTTAASYTTAPGDFGLLQTYWDVTPNVNLTLTINATSTFAYVPEIGDTAKIFLRNASSTAASTITLAAQNASVDMQTTEATGGDLVLNGLDWAELTFIRESATLVTVIFDEFIEAD